MSAKQACLSPKFGNHPRPRGRARPDSAKPSLRASLSRRVRGRGGSPSRPLILSAFTSSSWEDRKDRKGVRDRFSGSPTLLCPDASFPSMSTSLRDLCVLLCRFPSCGGGTSEGDRRWRAASESPVRSEIGPYQHRDKARVGLAGRLDSARFPIH